MEPDELGSTRVLLALVNPESMLATAPDRDLDLERIARPTESHRKTLAHTTLSIVRRASQLVPRRRSYCGSAPKRRASNAMRDASHALVLLVFTHCIARTLAFCCCRCSCCSRSSTREKAAMARADQGRRELRAPSFRSMAYDTQLVRHVKEQRSYPELFPSHVPTSILRCLKPCDAVRLGVGVLFDNALSATRPLNSKW